MSASPAAAAPSTQFLERPEGRVAYDVQGAGPLLVLVPGMGELRSSYGFLTPRLVEVDHPEQVTGLVLLGPFGQQAGGLQGVPREGQRQPPPPRVRQGVLAHRQTDRPRPGRGQAAPGQRSHTGRDGRARPRLQGPRSGGTLDRGDPAGRGRVGARGGPLSALPAAGDHRARDPGFPRPDGSTELRSRFEQARLNGAASGGTPAPGYARRGFDSPAARDQDRLRLSGSGWSRCGLR